VLNRLLKTDFIPLRLVKTVAFSSSFFDLSKESSSGRSCSASFFFSFNSNSFFWMFSMRCFGFSAWKYVLFSFWIELTSPLFDKFASDL